MNHISSYYEIDKENIFTKGKNNCNNETFFDKNRTPLRDITYLFLKDDVIQKQEKVIFNSNLDC